MNLSPVLYYEILTIRNQQPNHQLSRRNNHNTIVRQHGNGQRRTEIYESLQEEEEGDGLEEGFQTPVRMYSKSDKSFVYPSKSNSIQKETTIQNHSIPTLFWLPKK